MREKGEEMMEGCMTRIRDIETYNTGGPVAETFGMECFPTSIEAIVP